MIQAATPAVGRHRLVRCRPCAAAFGTSTGQSLEALKAKLLKATSGTQRGKATPAQKRKDILELLEALEARNTVAEPVCLLNNRALTARHALTALCVEDRC